MEILKLIYFLMYFRILLPRMLLYFRYCVNMHCCDHVELNSSKIYIYLDVNDSSVEEFGCISVLNASTCNEIPMEYPVPNMLLKILWSLFLINYALQAYSISFGSQKLSIIISTVLLRVLFFLWFRISLSRMPIIFVFLFGFKNTTVNISQPSFQSCSYCRF